MGFPFRSESFREGIVLSTAFSIGAKAVAFLVNPAIAFYFGANASTDVYFFCLSAVSVLAGFVTSLSSSVLIPHSTHLLIQRGARDSQAFLNFFLYAYCALTLGLMAIALVAPEAVLGTISRFGPKVVSSHATLIRCFGVVLCLMTVSSLLTDILFSYRYFTVPMICSGATSALSLVILITLHGSLGMLCVPVAMLLAQTLQVVLLMLTMKRALGWNFRLVSSAKAGEIRRDLAVSYLGSAGSALTYYLPSLLMSGFGAGTLTALSYAQSAANIPGVLLTSQYSAVAGIKLNELCARRDYDGVNRVFVAAANLLHFLLIPVACLMALLSREIVVVLFHRGMTTAETIGASAAFLGILVFQAPLHALNTLSARLFMADRQIAFSVWYQIAFSALLFGSIWGMVAWIGPLGYPTALVVLYSMNLVALIWILGWRFPFLQYSGVLRSGAWLLLVNAALLALAYGMLELAVGVAPMIRIGLVTAVYLAALAVLNGRFRLNADAAQLVRAAWTVGFSRLSRSSLAMTF